ncbi:Nose resistant to fluoxetine protein 6, partial [Araneus ventricosus]
LDSYGKPESGILLGNFKWLGEYDECLGVYAPPKANSSVGNFHGKYCTLEVPLKLQNMTLPLSTALCLPDSCNPDGTFLGDIMQKFNLSEADEETESVFGNVTLTCKPTSRKLTTGAIVTMCFLSIIVLLVATGSSITAFEYCIKENVSKETLYAVNTTGKSLIDADRENGIRGTSDDVYLSGTKNKITLPAWLEKCKTFFNCFCIFTNGEKLLNVSSSEGQLPCLHGIRFLTMAWVILCHTYLEAFATSMRNPLEAKDMVDHWTFQIIINGFLSVDSFFLLRATDFFDLIYHKPYNRIGPYLIGILLAYYFYKRKQNNAPKLKLAFLAAGWIIAASIALACQFSLFHENFSRVETSFYNALSRSGFACGVAWVIFVCVTGQGGVVNSVLSWKVWIPFSRLTYCAYLLHPIIHNAFFVSVRRLMEFSHTNVILLYLGFLIISYAVALLTSLLFESPVIRLERHLRNKAAS